MELQPLPLGQIQPLGALATAMRQTWNGGLPEGSPSWLRHALLVGEGRGKLLVRSWARRTGVLESGTPLAVPSTPVAAWAEALESRTFLNQGPWDEYVPWMVLADPAGLRVALYGPATVKTEVFGVPLVLELDTVYPVEPRVELRLYPEAAVEFTLSLRLPGWASGCLVTGDGASGAEAEDRDGWIEVRRLWHRGDSLTLTFDRLDPSPQNS